MAGGLVWAAPTILSSSAAHASEHHGSCSCGDGAVYFGVKFEPNSACQGIGSQGGQCFSSFPNLINSACLCFMLELNQPFTHDDGDVSISIKPQFRSKVKIVAGGKKGGSGGGCTVQTGNGCNNSHVHGGVPLPVCIVDCHTFTSKGPQNSHVELVLCVTGTLPEGCPAP